ncbi:MAG: ribosome biogenesis GTPase Der [Patescibacteria group bacterium]
MKGALSKEYESLPKVALVGRTNVGKSTLFNRLIGEQKAVVAPVPGTTRDSNFGICTWRGRQFVVVDTGGYDPKPKTDIDTQTQKQLGRIIKDADIVLFVVDGQEGITVDDNQFLRNLRKATKRPIIAVGNKVDKISQVSGLYDQTFLRLGLGAPIPVSAASGLGVGDLLDIVMAHFVPEEKEQEASETKPIKIAIIGRTNVGKSSLVNGMLGEERVIVSPIAHTTREPQDTHIEYKGIPLVIVDTVGMRKKGKVRSIIDREGLLRSIKSIKKADVVILILDASVTATTQERKLLQIAIDVGAGIMLIINKWDLVEDKNPKTILSYERYFREKFSFVPWAPMLFVSALAEQRVSKILDMILAIQTEREKLLEQKDCTVFLKQMIKRQPPQILRNRKKPVIFGFKQTGTCPPRFCLSVNEPDSFSYAYLRFLENRLRELFGFAGTAVVIYTEQRRRHV